MIDTTTRKPLQVQDGGQAGPYLIIPVESQEKVQTLLDANQIDYWVDDLALSVNGEPEVTFVNISPGTDPALIQKLLDNEP